MARKSKSRQEGQGRSRRRSALLFLARWSLVLLIWTGFLAGGIVLWYARDLPDTSRLNEIWQDRLEVVTEQPAHPPAQVMAQSGASRGAPGVLARAHHGSVSKEHRAAIEEDLKAGRLPAVVATSSLELGIDMGAVDLVIQIESPPSVASALQRVGRAGHQVGEVSRGVLFPKHRGDLAQTAVAVQRMQDGAIESMRVPTNPLDVLAQQVVAATAVDSWDADELYELDAAALR